MSPGFQLASTRLQTLANTLKRHLLASVFICSTFRVSPLISTRTGQPLGAEAHVLGVIRNIVTPSHDANRIQFLSAFFITQMQGLTSWG